MRYLLPLLLFTVAIQLQAAKTLKIAINPETRVDLPKFMTECMAVAKSKLIAQAKAFDVSVDTDSLVLVDIDRSVLADYAWWQMNVTDIKGRRDLFPTNERPALQLMTQKPRFEDCF